ncbi:DUF5723 family protein [Sunxiuqinia sp. A32]|uniref:DUF5723 family protein n=1 Tax=Sunxiuqinia sp. A32 TaxID=3461496 RepID=UPI0040452200
MYNTHELFNSSNYNPAFLSSDEKFTFSIFPLAGMSASLNDQEALRKVSDLLFFDEINEGMKDIFKSMVNKRLFYQHGEAALLNFGYHDDFGSFSFVIKDHVRLMVDFKGELSKFLMNSVDLSTRLDFVQEFPAEAIHFREYSLGYSKEIVEDKFSIGARAKLLFGKSFISSQVAASAVESEGNFYVVSQGTLDISVPAKRITDSNGQFVRLDPFATQSMVDYVMNAKNTGIAFDLGAKYMINPYWEVSASVIDLGNIKWNNNLHKMVFNGAYELDPSDVLVSSVDGVNIISKRNTDVSLEDDISDLFGVPEVSDAKYSGAIPASFYVGTNYHVNSSLHLGLVDRLVKYGELSYNSLALTANYRLDKRFTLVSGYSAYGNSFINIPLGIFYKWNSGQAYISSDNLVSIVAPSVSDFIGISFGASFYIFRPKMKYDRIYYLPFFKKKRKRNTNQKGLIFKAE